MFVFCFSSPHTCPFLGRANGRASGSRESRYPAHSGFAEGICLGPRRCWGRLVQPPALTLSSQRCGSLTRRRAADARHPGEVMDSGSLLDGQGPTGLKGWQISFPLLQGGNHRENHVGNGISIPAGRIMSVLRIGQLGLRRWLLSRCPVSCSNPALALRPLCVPVLASRRL